MGCQDVALAPLHPSSLRVAAADGVRGERGAAVASWVLLAVVAKRFEAGVPRILVVDDDPLIRATVAELLVDEGYAVSQAGDGAEALLSIQQFVPDAIVLDLMMPILDGWQFVDRIRTVPDWRDVPIVVMSATHRLHESAERLHAMGVRAVLAKPFDVDALIAIVQRYAPLAA